MRYPRLMTICAASAAFFGLNGLVGPMGGAEAAELKLGHVYETGHPIHIAAAEAAEYFGKCTGGSQTMQVYPASQLGKETALNEQIRFGGVDVILTGQIFASGEYPPLAVGAAPYIFRDRDHALAYRTSDVFKELMAGWSEATGQHMLGAAYFGAFQVGTKSKPINSAADFKGLKIRIPDSPFYAAFPDAVGANPTPVAFAEVYLALQQGVVEGTVNPIPVIYAKKFYEVLDYVAITNHLVEYVLWAVGDHVWSQLSDAEKTCMQEAVDRFGQSATDAVVKQEDELQQLMSDKGWLKFTHPDAAEFQKMTAPIIKAGVENGTWSQEIVDRIAAIH